MTKEETLELEEEKACYCPYCNGDLTMLMPFYKSWGPSYAFVPSAASPCRRMPRSVQTAEQR